MDYRIIKVQSKSNITWGQGPNMQKGLHFDCYAV